MERNEVYKLIDEEREYQNSKPPRPKSDAETSVAEWIIYIEYILDDAKYDVYHLDESSAMSAIRKLAALAVAAMEHNETPRRAKE